MGVDERLVLATLARDEPDLAEEGRPRPVEAGPDRCRSLMEAEDAVQETWVKVSRTDAREVENLSGWLTTAISRVCLNMLRSRRSRREDPLNVHVPDPIVDRAGGVDPEHQAILADSLGLALLVVLEKLAPAERVAFVLHDVFAVPFDEIAEVVGRSPAATRQLASRGRRRVRLEGAGGGIVPDADRSHQRAAVDAFLAAARGGDLAGLLTVLDPNVILRADGGPTAAGGTREVRGAKAVAGLSISFTRRLAGLAARPALVNGAVGIVSRGPDGQLLSIMGFTVAHGRIVEIDILADIARLAALDLPALDD
ncbi:MAG: sigma-70 family RNA polymerase sigma factor [Candidatus Limnocylindrales bacterium]